MKQMNRPVTNLNLELSGTHMSKWVVFLFVLNRLFFNNPYSLYDCKLDENLFFLISCLYFLFVDY